MFAMKFKVPFLLLMVFALYLSTSPVSLAQEEGTDEYEEFFEEDQGMEQAPQPQQDPPPPPNNNQNAGGAEEVNTNNTDDTPRFGNKSSPRFAPPSRFKSTTTSATGNNPMPNAKMKFAEAHPEDINNKNFPDVIESFDYPNAEISDVIKAMSKLTGKNIIMEKGISGKITIIAPSAVTVAEAWEAFLAALAINNLTIVPYGKFLKIRKIADAKTDSIETYSGAYYPTSDQLITRILKLKFIKAKDVETTLRPFKSKTGEITAYEETNSLIISDLGSSVERISRIVQELDKPGHEERLEVFPIKHAKASNISDLIDKIINKDEKKSGSRFSSRSRFGAGGDRPEALSLVAPDERTNAIIVVGNGQGIDYVKKLINQLDYPLDAGEFGGVQVYYVKHGDAKKIAETLSGIAQESAKQSQSSSAGASSTGGTGTTATAPIKRQQIFGGDVIIKADESTNSLIITAGKQDYEVIKNLLAKIDIPRDQVFVETIIMEMTTDKNDLWDTAYFKFTAEKGTTDTGTGRLGFVGSDKSISKLSNIATPGAFLSFGNKDLFTLNIPGGGSIQIPNLVGFVNFLKTYTAANILSTPNLLVMDNEEGKIEVGEDAPVGQTFAATGAGAAAGAIPLASTQFKEAVLGLEIKPFISPDSDIVRMTVKQKIDKVSTRVPQAQQLAATSQGLTKRKLETHLTLKSGDTAVLGGLMQDEDNVVEGKVPILGDIPILGWLFKSKSVSKKKSNLVIFLTPTIVRNAFDHAKILKNKLADRINWIKNNANGRDPYGAKFAEVEKNMNKSASGSSYESGFSAPEVEVEKSTEEAEPPLPIIQEKDDLEAPKSLEDAPSPAN